MKGNEVAHNVERFRINLFGTDLMVTRENGLIVSMNLFGGQADLPHDHEFELLLKDWLEGDQNSLAPFPHELRVSDFQKGVLETLRERVPKGRTCTYGELAAMLGGAKYTRAVAGALASNPLPLFYPCHRVIGADGSLTGFAFGLELKEKLLEFERPYPDAH